MDPVDFRKGIDGLAGIVRALDLDPFSGYLFVFRSRSGTSLKVISYDGQGYWLCQKRLSKGRFRCWPKADGTAPSPGRPRTPGPSMEQGAGEGAVMATLEIMLDTEDSFSVYSRPWSIAGATSALRDIELIRGLIAEGLNRSHLSRVFCEKTGWRKPDGGLKEMSCRVALLKMERDGHIILPPPQRARQQSSEKAERDDASPAHYGDGRGPRARTRRQEQRAPSGTPTSTGTTTSAIRPCPVRSSGTSSERKVRSSPFWVSPPPHGSAPPGIVHRLGRRDEKEEPPPRRQQRPVPHPREVARTSPPASSPWRQRGSPPTGMHGTAMHPSFLRPSSITSASPERAIRLQTGSVSARHKDRGKLDIHHEHKLPVKSVWLYPLNKDFRRWLT